jgi:hypothetical protein
MDEDITYQHFQPMDAAANGTVQYEAIEFLPTSTAQFHTTSASQFHNGNASFITTGPVSNTVL